MTQFVLDKSTWSIFISLLSSTGLLMDRSFLLWATGVRLTGQLFSQVSFSLLVVHSPGTHRQFYLRTPELNAFDLSMYLPAFSPPLFFHMVTYLLVKINRFNYSQKFHLEE